MEETWVVTGEVERMLPLTPTLVTKRQIQEFRLALRCGGDTQPLPHRTCVRVARGYAIVDGRAIRRVREQWRDDDCNVVGEVRVGRRWEALHFPVDLHTSLRRLVEQQ